MLKTSRLHFKVAEDRVANFSQVLQVHLSGCDGYSCFRTWSSNANIWEKMVHRLHRSQGQEGALGWTQSHFSMIQEWFSCHDVKPVEEENQLSAFKYLNLWLQYKVYLLLQSRSRYTCYRFTSSFQSPENSKGDELISVWPKRINSFCTEWQISSWCVPSFISVGRATLSFRIWSPVGNILSMF